MNKNTPKESVKDLNKQIEKTFSEQKQKKREIQKSFLERNKKLIIIMIAALSILFILVTAYANWGLNQISHELSNL